MCATGGSKAGKKKAAATGGSGVDGAPVEWHPQVVPGEAGQEFLPAGDRAVSHHFT